MNSYGQISGYSYFNKVGVNKPSGTLNCISPVDISSIDENTTFPGNLKIGLGTLNLSENTLDVQGDVTITGGKITVGGGQLNVGGDLALSYATSNFSQPFYSTSGGLDMSNSVDYVLVNGNMTVQSDSGSIFSAGTLEIKGNFTQSIFYAYYDYDYETVYGASGFSASGTHKTLFSGTADQTISFVTPTNSFGQFSYGYSYFNKLGVNKPSGTLNCISPVIITSIDENTTFPGNLKIRYGTFNLSGNTLDVQGDVTITGGKITVGGGQLNIGGNLDVSNTTYTFNSKNSLCKIR
jgi:phage baseplate assembly protein gpV